MTLRSRFIAAAGGTILVALCCFTPVLVLALAAAGLAAFTPYLHLVLLPVLTILMIVTWISYRRYTRSAGRT